MKKLIAFALIVITMMSCREEAIEGGAVDFYYDTPQPINDSELSAIPAKFIGTYLNDNQAFYITDSAIVTDYSFNTAYHKSAIDSLGIYKNGKVISKDTNEAFDAVVKGDSIHVTGRAFRDTIFRFSPLQKAKRINGCLVISSKDSTFWKTSIIFLKNDSLKVAGLNSKIDYINLQPLVKNIKAASDTSVVHLNPTRTEFKRILKLNKFGREQVYRKLNK